MTAPAIVPRTLVPSPPAPVPQRFGLFSAASIQEGVQPHELGGISYEAVCSTRVDPYPAPCPNEPTPPPARAKTPHPTTSMVEATPFAVYAADECALGRDEAEARDQLRQRFLLGEQRVVERVVHSGELGNIQNFAKLAEPITTEPASDGGYDIHVAIGLAEQWLAEHWGGAGVIHAPRWTASQLLVTGVAGVSGSRASSLLGSSLVFGTGYPGTAPEGYDEETETVWLYVTPPVNIRRTNVLEPGSWTTGAYSKEENRGFLLEERIYLVDWPCTVGAIKTDIPRVTLTDAAAPTTVARIEEES